MSLSVRKRSHFKTHLSPRWGLAVLLATFFSGSAQAETAETKAPAGQTTSSATRVVLYDVTIPGARELARSTQAVAIPLRPSRTGLSQALKKAAQRGSLTEMHLITHGTAGALVLGTETVDAREFGGMIQSAKTRFADNADLLIYGCAFGQGESGKRAVSHLSRSLSVDVAASDDKTGNPQAGGDWNLEVQVGGTTAKIPFSEKARKQLKTTLERILVYDGGSDSFVAWNPNMTTFLTNDGHNVTVINTWTAPTHTSVNPAGYDWVLLFRGGAVPTADLNTFLGQGGYVYRQSEVGCCNNAAAAAQAEIHALVVGGTNVLHGGAQISNSIGPATWMTNEPTCASNATFVAVRAFTNIPNGNVLISNPSQGVGGVVFSGSSLIAGNGTYAATGDYNAVVGGLGSPAGLSLAQLTANATHIRKVFPQAGAPTGNYGPVGGPCITATCGDGTKAASEGCDDGNTTAGDGCSASCSVEAGYTCVHNSGQSPNSTCTDDDECALGTDNCHANATCSNTPGSFSCACNSGYSGNGVTCSDINECTLGTDNCHANATCSNTPGSFSCACNSGYSGNGVTCSDINECTLGTDNCHANATCSNTPGSFSCACNSGYSGNGVTCSDINECTLGTDDCDQNATCSNTVGSFSCACKPGYTGNGKTCTDINECTLGTDNCHNDAICTNTPGAFTCTCKPGYTGNGTTTCSDIDECTLGTDDCDQNATCSNTVGSFSCKCKDGYVGDGKKCDADTDKDGLSDDEEKKIGSDPNDADSDDDGVIDGDEPKGSEDSDGDGLINILDPDSDNDGLFDGTELSKDCTNAATDPLANACRPDTDPATSTDPLVADTDGGGMGDGSEDANLNGKVDAGESNPVSGQNADDANVTDADKDGLSDTLENFLGSNPNDADSDDDGLLDGDEDNPSHDTDGDGLVNVIDVDSDDDALHDGLERGKNCDNPATDKTKGHCMADKDTGATRTSTLLKDTDGGGASDGSEDVNPRRRGGPRREKPHRRQRR